MAAAAAIIAFGSVAAAILVQHEHRSNLFPMATGLWIGSYDRGAFLPVRAAHRSCGQALGAGDLACPCRPIVARLRQVSSSAAGTDPLGALNRSITSHHIAAVAGADGRCWLGGQALAHGSGNPADGACGCGRDAFGAYDIQSGDRARALVLCAGLSRAPAHLACLCRCLDGKLPGHRAGRAVAISARSSQCAVVEGFSSASGGHLAAIRRADP